MREVLHIDWTRCDGRGLCTELLPTLLGRDDWGYPLAMQAAGGDPSNVVIDFQHSEAAADAVKLCPKMALALAYEADQADETW
ncbi:ferredoxin [Arthrobacter cryoconiti]|uniref:Ferredoxin n=1 Tax=Arthrobacter cryoconiti TaxID=748907 RepID=A0ABV8R099_9MICC|nr:ferredoxin [Arthrobacter cryoconiti]MCC9069879.1 ferredoxin [Arthrobacter cryoconiti]